MHPIFNVIGRALTYSYFFLDDNVKYIYRKVKQNRTLVYNNTSVLIKGYELNLHETKSNSYRQTKSFLYCCSSSGSHHEVIKNEQKSSHNEYKVKIKRRMTG